MEPSLGRVPRALCGQGYGAHFLLSQGRVVSLEAGAIRPRMVTMRGNIYQVAAVCQALC